VRRTATFLCVLALFLAACASLQPSGGSGGRPHTPLGDTIEAVGTATGNPLLVGLGVIISTAAAKLMAKGETAKKDAEAYSPEDLHAMAVGIAARPDLLKILADAMPKE
jgi:hypothetical protein